MSALTALLVACVCVVVGYVLRHKVEYHTRMSSLLGPYASEGVREWGGECSRLGDGYLHGPEDMVSECVSVCVSE
jgi:hypothetical protein